MILQCTTDFVKEDTYDDNADDDFEQEDTYDDNADDN